MAWDVRTLVRKTRTYCESCGKKKFFDLRMAEATVKHFKRATGEALYIYKCNLGGWHITSRKPK